MTETTAATPGFLANLGLTSEDIPDVSSGLPEGGYNGFIVEAKVEQSKDNTKTLLVLTYRVSEGAHTGGQAWERFDITSRDPEKLKWLKGRLSTLQIPEVRWGSINPQDLVGIPVYFKTKAKNGFVNIVEAKYRAEGNQFAGQGVTLPPAAAPGPVTAQPAPTGQKPW